MMPGRLSALLATAGAFALAAGAESGHPRRSGTVGYVTKSRLYLDAGSREGLAAGQMLQLHRGDRASGTCKVEQVFESRAICAGSGRPGDSFPLSPPAAVPPQPVQRAVPPAPPGVMGQRRAALASAVFPPVEFHESEGALAASRASAQVGIAHTTWASTGTGPWHQERATAALHVVPIGGGFTIDLDLSARRWSRRSEPISFRPEDAAQLYVWQASLSRRSAGGGPAFSVGRVRPWWTPGQVILDGAQAGWRTAGGAESGVFGGVVPDAVTLAPSFSRGTFGAYWAGRYDGARDSALRFFRHEARVAFVNTADLGKRIEGEGLLEARITRRLDAAVNVRVGAGDHSAPGAVDAVRVDGGARPFETLSLNGSFRYQGLSLPELVGPGRVLSAGAARHADLSAAWEPVSALRISVLSGLSTDLTTHQTRRWIGPEVALPVLFTGRAGVSAGYFQEDGWAPGRSAWLQLLGRSASMFQVLARLSWFRTRGIAPADLDELGASATLRAQLGRRVALRVSALGRTTLNGGRVLFGGVTGQTGVVDAALEGRF